MWKFLRNILAISLFLLIGGYAAQTLFAQVDTRPAEVRIAEVEPKDRATFKGQEIEKVAVNGTFIDSRGVTIEVENIRAIPNGVELYAKATKGGLPIGFGKDKTIETERFIFINPPLLVPDPAGNIVRRYTDKETGLPKERRLREDPNEALRQSLSHAIKVSGKEGAPVIPDSRGHTVSTFYPDPNVESTSVDGVSQNSPAGGDTWANVRNALAGTTTTDSTTDERVGAIETDGDNWLAIARGFFLFDSSSIPDTDTINSATFSLYALSKVDAFAASITLVSSTPASNTAIVNADFDQVGSTAFSTAKTIASITLSAYNDWALNATGLLDVSKTGISKFATRIEEDRANTEPTFAANSLSRLNTDLADAVGTTTDPKLVVNHSSASTTPPQKSIIILFHRFRSFLFPSAFAS